MAELARCHREAEEVTELMRQNVAKALERDVRLGELGGRAEELSAMSSTFRRSTRAVSRQQQRRSRRGCGGGRLRWALLGVGAAVLLLLVGLGVGLGLRWAAPTAAQRPTAPPGAPQRS